MRAVAVGLAAVLALAGAASAQVSSRAPEWARAFLVTESDAVNVRQAALAAPEGGLAVRLSVAPVQGGVGRLVRFEAAPSGVSLKLRRFTGHLRNGWVLWGAEQAVPAPIEAAKAAQIERLARAALAAGALGGENAAPASVTCASGDYAWIEIADPNRTTVFERRCAMDGAAGPLIRALIEAAGNRDEEELFRNGVAEVMAADRAFAAAARETGVVAATAAFATEDVRGFPLGGPIVEGREALLQRLQAEESPDLLQWAPAGAEVSARGDMATSWGQWTRASGLTGSYLAVWRRDGDGAWRVTSRILN
ncbi:MAG: DUF4440 domain-containing protein [Hyphomonadaceae bacterium]|nr:DUF4440 domain-containing protein [Hyphomonadaceae bacterium]